jgi:hypothetical protein
MTTTALAASKTRLHAAMFGLALFIAWPLVHAAITHSRSRGFTTWKLMGFGMFAEPHVYRTHVAIVVVPKGVHAPAGDPLAPLSFWRSLGPNREPFEVSVASETGWSSVDVSGAAFGNRPGGSTLGASAPGASYRARVTDVQCFYNSSRAISAITQGALVTADAPGAHAVAVITKPQLDMSRGSHYADSCVFTVDGDTVKQLGCETESAKIADLVARGLDARP